ncbi:DNA-directed RNA polymerase family protein [Rhynchospora pubera]|uniref:DNA-directed RNA polymerases I and III subunit RPAC1 n=1 Tax=Rhynchospora pubera TaxID=906938 RepID=A0AAV8FF41_9POAL|nr:DNA-directed RNA polymerase family protein [Rhynchospora pubera]KAJ4791878.1 DNA-directed RNA polymerase family protein [Rhynchospora pubera]
MTKKGFTSALDMPDVPMGKLPDHLEVQRTRVVCKADAPINTEGIQYSGSYATMGIDNSTPLERFRKNFKVEVIRLTEDEMEFDMIGIDAAIANAFRRILISEVPTMAIERVFMVDNTSPIVDEVLAHRLGLIPLDADPRLFEYMSGHDVANERNTIVFKLHVSCKKGSPRLTVKSDQLEWLPDGSKLHEVAPSFPGEQQKTYTSFSGSQMEVSKKPLGVMHKDITIARLGPGQTIELEAHAVKGIGKVHAKWSPVATAWYRMLPEVVFLKEVKGEEAVQLVDKCKQGVFDIEDLGNGERRAFVKNPRACTLCRECLRGVSEDPVELRRVRDHFIFTIESAAAVPPEVLFTEAVKILEEKCERVISELS